MNNVYHIYGCILFGAFRPLASFEYICSEKIHKLCRGPSNEYSCQVCMVQIGRVLVEKNMRMRRFTTADDDHDGRQVMEIPHMTLSVR